MSMLYLRHPAVGNDGTVLDLILTRGDSDQVGGGSERFVNAVSSRLGIKAQPRKWSIRPFRSNFYGEYWMEEGWEPKWDFVWRMTVHFRTAVSVEPLKLGYLGLDEIDDYSPFMESYKFEPFACLAIAAFLSEPKAEAAARRVVEDRDLLEARRAVGVQSPAVDVLRVGDDFHLRAVLGSGEKPFFTSNYPGMVLSMLEKTGGIVHAEN